MPKEDFGCQQTQDDFDCIQSMIEQAAESGLAADVVMSFGDHRAQQVEVQRACLNALYDWDC